MAHSVTDRIPRASTGAHPGRRRLVARAGEDAAADFYVRAGATIVARNWRSGRFGEIDLILRQRDGLLVFVEVKTRAGSGPPAAGFGLRGFEAVNKRKQQKIVTLARTYLSRFVRGEPACRLDVVVVDYRLPPGWSPEDPLPEPTVVLVAGALGL